VDRVGIQCGRPSNSDLKFVYLKARIHIRVPKGVEDGRRLPPLQAGHPQGKEGSGMAGPGKTLGSP
jgi:hypothetical protein